MSDLRSLNTGPTAPRGEHLARLTGGRRISPTSGAAETIVSLCLAYILWRPVSAGYVLYPVLAAMAVVCAGIVWRERPVIPTALLAAWLLLLLVAGSGAVVGSFADNPGLMQQAAHWFGSLLIWGAFAASMTARLLRLSLITVTLVTAVHAILLLLLFAQTILGLSIPIPGAILASQGAFTTVSDGAFGVRWYGLSTLVAAAPLLVAMAIKGPDGIVPTRRLTVPVSVLATIAALSAGRRGILVIVVLAPLIVWALDRICKVQSPRGPVPGWRVFAIAAIPALVVLGWAHPVAVRVRGIVIDALLLYTGALDGSTASADDSPRVDQASRLLNQWEEGLLFGHGLGAVVPGYARSEVRPWSFELQYHQLLFNGGLFGIVLFLGALLLAFAALTTAVKGDPAHRSALVSTAVGAAALLVANASNPYLQAVGHGWGLALAAGAIVAVESARRPAGWAADPSTSVSRV